MAFNIYWLFFFIYLDRIDSLNHTSLNLIIFYDIETCLIYLFSFVFIFFLSKETSQQMGSETVLHKFRFKFISIKINIACTVLNWLIYYNLYNIITLVLQSKPCKFLSQKTFFFFLWSIDTYKGHIKTIPLLLLLFIFYLLLFSICSSFDMITKHVPIFQNRKNQKKKKNDLWWLVFFVCLKHLCMAQLFIQIVYTQLFFVFFLFFKIVGNWILT